MSVKHKVSGFLSAVVIAIVSFFVIYLFLPDFSTKYLGTSLKSDKAAQKTISSVEKETTETLNTVKDRIGDFFGK